MKRKGNVVEKIKWAGTGTPLSLPLSNKYSAELKVGIPKRKCSYLILPGKHFLLFLLTKTLRIPLQTLSSEALIKSLLTPRVRLLKAIFATRYFPACSSMQIERVQGHTPNNDANQDFSVANTGPVAKLPRSLVPGI